MNIEKSKNKPLPSVGDIVESVDSGNYYMIVEMSNDTEFTTMNMSNYSVCGITHSNIEDVMFNLMADNDYIIHKSHNLTLKINN